MPVAKVGVLTVVLVALMFVLAASVALGATNGKIVYECSSGICSVNPDGSGNTTLAGPPSGGVGLTCAPDGSVILYGAGGGISEINADGSNQHLLVSGGNMPSFGWSGTEFVYETSIDESINFWSPSGGFESSIQPGGAIINPQIFPSGTEVLWGNGTFFTANRNGTGIAKINTGTLKVYNPAITPSDRSWRLAETYRSTASTRMARTSPR